MAVTVDILKLTQIQGVVAVREDGNTPAPATVALATTLKKGTETQSSPTVDISAILWALDSGVTATVAVSGASSLVTNRLSFGVMSLVLLLLGSHQVPGSYLHRR